MFSEFAGNNVARREHAELYIKKTIDKFYDEMPACLVKLKSDDCLLDSNIKSGFTVERRGDNGVIMKFKHYDKFVELRIVFDMTENYEKAYDSWDFETLSKTDPKFYISSFSIRKLEHNPNSRFLFDESEPKIFNFKETDNVYNIFYTILEILKADLEMN
jgi:hypothetical protein